MSGLHRYRTPYAAHIACRCRGERAARLPRSVAVLSHVSSLVTIPHSPSRVRDSIMPRRACCHTNLSSYRTLALLIAGGGTSLSLEGAGLNNAAESVLPYYWVALPHSNGLRALGGACESHMPISYVEKVIAPPEGAVSSYEYFSQAS